MSDTPNGPDEPTPPDEAAGVADADAGQSSRGGSPSAAAARRARRIGGLPSSGAGARKEEPLAPSPAPRLEKQPRRDSGATAGAVPPPPARAAEPGAPANASAVPDWLIWTPAAVASVGAVVMAVLLIVFSHGVWWGPDPTKVPGGAAANVTRDRVLAAAKTCVADANSYKYTDLAGFESKALACTTGVFTGHYKDIIDTVIKVNAPKLKASQTAQINKGGIEAVSADGTQWTILLFGQLTVTNANASAPRTDPFGAQVRMERVGGKWLISALTTVSNPTG